MIKLNVIGDPIMHSRSPKIHGLVLSEIGVDFEYERVLVKKGELSSYIKSAIDGGVDGFNLTMPHKVDIIPYLKEIDFDAKIFGAVNTVKIKNGELYGFNTDAMGLILALSQNGFSVKDKNITILGAGGVSSTIAMKFAIEGASEIRIFNRSVDKAREICEKIENVKAEFCIKTKTMFGGFESAYIAEGIKNTDLLINATPLGMTGVDGDYEDLSFIDSLKKDAMVCDLIYSPPKTKFLSYAKDKGHRIMNGYGMLISQAILADEIYLEQKLDIGKLFTNIVNNS